MKKLIALIPPGILLLIGIGVAGWGLFSFFGFMFESGSPLTAPGITTLNIVEQGDYTLWNQTQGIVDGQFKTFPSALPPGVVIHVRKLPQGADIPLRTTFSATLNQNQTHLAALGEFTFPEPGNYQVEITGLRERRALFLRESKLTETILTFLATEMAALFVMAIGIGYGIYVLVRSPRKKR